MAEAEQSTQIALFKGKEIRKTIHGNEWWFSVVDVIEALTDSGRSRNSVRHFICSGHIGDIKKRFLK